MLPRLGMRGPAALAGRCGRRPTRCSPELGEGRRACARHAGARPLASASGSSWRSLKALALDSRILIFDEPTAAALAARERAAVRHHPRPGRRAAAALIFVSHRLEEISAMTDRVTVLREGQVVAGGVPTPALTQAGAGAADGRARAVRHLRTAERSERRRVRGQWCCACAILAARRACATCRSTSVRGEIVGLAGLVGAGRSETLETIFGLRTTECRHDRAERHDRSRAHSPREAIRAGIGLVPEDRRGQGIVPGLLGAREPDARASGRTRRTGAGLRRARRTSVRRLARRSWSCRSSDCSTPAC